MLFLLALPVISCVALFWRYVQIYAPSNVLIRRVRSGPPRWHTVPAVIALAAVLLLATNVVGQAIERGAPGWLNLVVIVLALDGVKMACLAAAALLRCVAAAWRRMIWCSASAQQIGTADSQREPLPGVRPVAP